MNKIKIFIILIICLTNYNLYSQESNFSDENYLTPISPNISDLGKYGKIPVSLFNGLPNINIPIYNIRTGDLQLPISLSYHARGHSPDAHPGWVGLGWNLFSGGSISRKINGGLDEVGGDDAKYSYYDNYSALDIPNWYTYQIITDYMSDDKAIPSPDEFSFNFNGYSGSFYLKENGQWEVVTKNNSKIKIEVELMEDFAFKPFGDKIEFEIKRIFYSFNLTTEDGIKYVFGGTSNSIEFNRNKFNNSEMGNHHVIPNTWHLTKIIDTNQKEIILEYSKHNYLLNQTNTLYSLEWVDKENHNQEIATNSFGLSMIYPSYLKEIITDKETVKFSISETNELEYEFQPNPDYEILKDVTYKEFSFNEPKWFQLDNISIYNNETTSLINSYNFSYTDNADERLKLLKIDQVKSGGNKIIPSYEFHYNPTNLPIYNSNETDHWGFYNGLNYFNDFENEALSPINLDDLYASKEPNKTKMKAEILEKVVYPTGGQTVFEFEPHVYSKVVTDNSSTINNLTDSEVAGGLRIKSISSYSNDGISEYKKKYFYKTNFAENGDASSGVLGGYPNYLEEYDTEYFYYKYVTDNTAQPFIYTNGSHVTYSEVAEVNSDGSYNVFKYSNLDDSFNMNEPPLNGMYYLEDNQNEEIDAAIVIPTTSRSLERGNILSEVLYSSNNLKIKEIEYSYNQYNKFNKYIKIFDIIRLKKPQGLSDVSHDSNREFPFFNKRIFANKIYTYIPKVASKTIKTYNENGDDYISTTTEYKYHSSNNQLVSVKNSFSDEFNKVVHHTYCDDYNSNEDFINSLKEKNIYTPIESVEYLESTSDEGVKIILNGKVTEFTSTDEPLIEKVYFLKLDKECLLQDFKFSNRNKGSAPNTTSTNTTYNKDLKYKLAYHVTAYDDFSNPTELKNHEKGMINSFVWSSDGNDLLGKLTNVSNTQLLANGESLLLKIRQLESSEFRYLPSEDYKGGFDELNSKIRNELPIGGQIVTYTYKPSIGINSVTDENGISTFYDYDDIHRLNWIFDLEGNVLKHIDYKYRGDIDEYDDVKDDLNSKY